MLEQFTDEQIEQIRKELKEIDHKSQKQYSLRDQVERIENMFPRSIYTSAGNGLFATGQIKDVLFILCDHLTNNYEVKTKRTRAHNGQHLVRSSCIPDSVMETYRGAFTDLVNCLEKWNVPFSEFKANKPSEES